MNETIRSELNVGMSVKYNIGFNMYEPCTVFDILSLPVPKDKGNLDEGFIHTLHVVLLANDKDSNTIVYPYKGNVMVYKIVPIDDDNLELVNEFEDMGNLYDNIPDTLLTPEEWESMNA